MDDNLNLGPNADQLNSHHKYLSNPQNGINGLNPSEQDINEFLSLFFEVHKIPENPPKKTPDFSIPSFNIVIEVKSMNEAYVEKISPSLILMNFKDNSGFIEKINLSLNQMILQFKDHLNSIKIAAIWIAFDQHILGSFNVDEDLIKRTDFIKLDLQGLLIYFQSAGGENPKKLPRFYSRNNELFNLFNSFYSDQILTKTLVIGGY